MTSENLAEIDLLDFSEPDRTDQAQLNQPQAEIAQASAKYDYEIQMSALQYQIGALH